MHQKLKRRNVLLSLLACAGSQLAHSARANSQETQLPQFSQLPEQQLGKTGVRVPILGLGGAGQTPLSWENSEAQAIALVERALALGIRYIDTSANYGPSEEYLGKVLPAYRSKIFLATKTGERDRDGAWRELERSLQRLKTDRLDLWQLHNVAYTEQLDAIFSANGAVQALEEAKQQGIVRFVGITGHHDPAIIVEGIRRYPFDTTLIPINAVDKHHPASFITTALPVTRDRQVGVIAMKVPAYGRLFKPGVLEGMHQALGYTLSQEGVDCCVIAAETPEQLEANVKVAQAFQPLSTDALAAIEQRTAPVYEEMSFFRNW